MALHSRWYSQRLQIYDGAYTAIGGKGIDFSTVDSSAFLHGGGTATYPITSATAGKFMSYYVKTTATGDTRGLYVRLYLSTGGNGEALRAYTTISDAVGATAHGAHLSLDFAATGSLSGLGVASRNTLHIPNAAMTGGTYAAMQAEIHSDGSSSDPAAVTELSFLRLCADGDAAGIATVDDKAFLFTLDGGAIATGNVVCAKSSAAVSHVARCKIHGTPYYLMLSNQI